MKKDRERKRQEILQRIRGFRLMDDEFMTKCFEENTECTELVLRIVMYKDDLRVKSARTQYTLKNLQGRSVRLDILALTAWTGTTILRWRNPKRVPVQKEQGITAA